MSPEEMRVAIAKVLGFLDIHRGSRRGTRTPNGNTLWATKDAPSINYPREYSVVPNYPADLNSCHEMEKVLTPLQWSDYVTQLIGLMPNGAGRHCDSRHATALQRCTAFLRTLGLYETSNKPTHE